MSFRSERGSVAALRDRLSDNELAEINLSLLGWVRRCSPPASLLAKMALPFGARLSLSANSGAPNSARDHRPAGS